MSRTTLGRFGSILALLALFQLTVSSCESEAIESPVQATTEAEVELVAFTPKATKVSYTYNGVAVAESDIVHAEDGTPSYVGVGSTLSSRSGDEDMIIDAEVIEEEIVVTINLYGTEALYLEALAEEGIDVPVMLAMEAQAEQVGNQYPEDYVLNSSEISQIQAWYQILAITAVQFRDTDTGRDIVWPGIAWFMTPGWNDRADAHHITHLYGSISRYDRAFLQRRSRMAT